jgi:Dyp-type peroxidase family
MKPEAPCCAARDDGWPDADSNTELDLDDMQRLIVYGFGERPKTLYVLLRIADRHAAKDWLRAHLPAPGSQAAAQEQKPHVPRARRSRDEAVTGVRLALAFTYLGLEALGLDRNALETFAPEFREGITEAHRARAIGDVGRNASDQWLWGQWPEGTHAGRQVHLLCAAYAPTEAELDAWRASFQSPAFEVVDVVRATLSDREPFGFRDGISQPYIKGSGRTAEKVAERDRVAAGEFVLGYRNGVGQFSESPRVSSELASKRLRRTIDTKFRDLGRNGTFLVVRELEQNVEEFSQLSQADAARVVGRWRDGRPLVLHRPPLGPSAPPAGPTPPSPYRLNDFTYFPEDAAGLRCPLGAHVRRANPRDALAAPETGTSPDDAIELANTHRILRRSRIFKRDDSGAEGIFFLCINTNLERQFEFVMQTWINNPKFNGPYEERDPLVGAGDHHALTIATAPERKRLLDLPSYVTVRGGAYFFLPGLAALAYLSE